MCKANKLVWNDDEIFDDLFIEIHGQGFGLLTWVTGDKKATQKLLKAAEISDQQIRDSD